MIEYVEVREKATRKVIGNIDTAKSIIWEATYRGTGTFEIYVALTAEIFDLLQAGNYITRPDRDECGIVEHVEVSHDPDDGLMIIASGRFAKAILGRRIVYTATLMGEGYQYWWSVKSATLRGNVETAVRKLIYDNAVGAVNENRNIPEIYWTEADVTGLSEVIVTQSSSGETVTADKQVTYSNLLDYSEGVLEEYGLGSKVWLDRDRLQFRYKIYKGADRSNGNAEGNPPLIFSEDFDNLLETHYTLDTSAYRSTALIGGEGEGEERKCAFAYEWIKGLDRYEVFVDASILTQEELTIENYRKQLEAQGQQTVAAAQQVETFDGTLDLTNSGLRYGVDYNLGDIITVEDKAIGKYIDARILSVTEVQDDDGYTVDVQYGI